MGKYREAQEVLDEHKKEIDKFFTDKNHPAHFSIMNNQALLYKVSGHKVKRYSLKESFWLRRSYLLR